MITTNENTVFCSPPNPMNVCDCNIAAVWFATAAYVCLQKKLLHDTIGSAYVCLLGVVVTW
jgi:hypothetical protein